MRIIRSYIVKECIFPFILALFFLTCLFLLGNLLQLTSLVINKGVSLSVIGKVFLLYVPVLLGYTIPIACLVSVILAFSRLSSDNEILALRACGIHLKWILLPMVVIGIIMSIICLILNERVIPYAHYEQQKTLKSLGASNPAALLEEGIFIHSFNSQILFIHKIDGNKLEGITIWQPQENGPTRTIIARKGEFTPVPGAEQIKLKLMNGTADERDANNPNKFYKLNFQNYFMTLDLTKQNQKIEKKPKGMTLKELKAKIAELERLLVDTGKLETEYYRKITWSFSALIFILLGFPIAVITHKRAKSANVVLAIAFAAVYYLLSLGCEALSSEQIVTPGLIMWVPNLVLGTLAAILNFKCAS